MQSPLLCLGCFLTAVGLCLEILQSNLGAKFVVSWMFSNNFGSVFRDPAEQTLLYQGCSLTTLGLCLEILQSNLGATFVILWLLSNNFGSV